MDKDRYEQIKGIVVEAMERSEPDRSHFLDEACGSDRKLRTTVEQLLAHDFPDQGVPLADRQPILDPGTRVGSYEIVSVLNEGGMGVVYHAKDLQLKRDVALKTPRAEYAANPNFRRRFLREGRAAAKISSPYVVPVFGSFEVDDVPWLAMELAEGVRLRDRIANGPVPVVELLAYAEQLCEGLEAVHGKRILHRDIKPENIMIGPDGRARLMDFGLATYWTSPEDMTAATTQSSNLTKGGAVGTLRYMSPEQSLGRKLDPRSDVFSLGAVFYEMCTGEPAFSASEEGGIRDAILNREPLPISRFSYEVPGEFERIIRKSMAKNRDERYRDAGDLLVDVRTLRKKRTFSDPPPPQPKPAAAKAALLITTLALLALVIWRVVPRPRESTIYRAEPTVTWPTTEFDARLSPDKEWISLVSNRDGAFNVWLQRRSGGDAARVTDETDTVVSHTWSPDGDEIAYATQSSEGAVIQIASVPFGDRPRLRIAESRFTSPSLRLVKWVGSKLYIEHRGSLWRMDTESFSLDQIERTDSPRQRHFDLLEDESRVVFAERGENGYDLWTSNLDGTARTRLTDDEHHESCPRWMGSAGDRVVFVSDRAGRRGLWQIDVDGGALGALSAGEEITCIDDVSADASMLTVSTTAEFSNLWRTKAGAERERAVTNDRLKDLAPAVSAHSQHVAFQRQLHGGSFKDAQVYTATWQSPDLVDLRLESESGFAPSLSADGAWLAFMTTSEPEGSTELRVKNLSTGQVRLLSRNATFTGYYPFPLHADARDMVWESARPELFFSATGDSGSAYVLRTRADEGEFVTDTLAVLSDLHPAHLTLSADDRTLAFVARSAYEPGRPQLYRVYTLDVRAGTTRVVHEDSFTEYSELRLVGFLDGEQPLVCLLVSINDDYTQRAEVLMIGPDGVKTVAHADRCAATTASLDPERRTLYLTKIDGRVHNLYELSFADGAWQRLTHNDRPRVTYSSAAPLRDGSVLYARQEEVRDVWLVFGETPD